MTANRSQDTDGTDHPTEVWLQRTVYVPAHPEWGQARVMRWYPATGGLPPRLRIMCAGLSAPQVVQVSEVEII